MELYWFTTFAKKTLTAGSGGAALAAQKSYYGCERLHLNVRKAENLKSALKVAHYGFYSMLFHAHSNMLSIKVSV